MSVKQLDISYGTETLQVRLQRRERRTLSISVDPRLTIDVVAPAHASADKIVEIVRKRVPWIKKQLGYFEQFLPRTPDRLYVSGATHLYLGRQYKLRVIRDSHEDVRLYRGELVVHTSRTKSTERVRELADQWYRERARLKFTERLSHCRKLFRTPDAFVPAELVVRHLRQRWGSMTPAGKLILNPALLKSSIDTIDYVITHELCHLRHAHHGQAFIKLLTQVMPDWKRRKLKLERRMA